MKKVKQLYLFKEVESHMRITDKIYVRAHQRNNGSYVREHWRKKPAKKGGLRKLSPTQDLQLSFIRAKKG